jgi:hypothetical protein
VKKTTNSADTPNSSNNHNNNNNTNTNTSTPNNNPNNTPNNNTTPTATTTTPTTTTTKQQQLTSPPPRRPSTKKNASAKPPTKKLDRFERVMVRLNKTTQVTDEKFQRLMDATAERRKQLKVARTGTLLQHHQPTDPFQIRKDLAIIDNKLKQVGKTAMSCSNTLPQHKPRKRPRPRRPPAVQPLMNAQGEGQWRHHLTMLFQDGLKELNFFFDACERSMDRSHRQEVLATLTEYHKLLHVTFEKIRVLRKESTRNRLNNSLRQSTQSHRRNQRRRQNNVLEDRLWLRLTTIEQDCRYVEQSNQKLKGEHEGF